MAKDVATAIERAREARTAGRLQDASSEYVQAAGMAKATGLTTELIVALEGIGQIEPDLRRPEVAYARYSEAVEVCRGANEPIRLADALRHLADIERERGHNEAAGAPALEAVGIYRRHSEVSPRELANALRVWALVQDARGDLAEAASAWREARGLNEAAGIKAGVRECGARLSDA